MADYSLSLKAERDLDKIYEYTILTFGLEQARDYLAGLHTQFQALANNPLFGRTAQQFAPRLRRIEYRSHMVFYLPEDNEIVIARVLHERMDAKRHL